MNRDPGYLYDDRRQVTMTDREALWTIIFWIFVIGLFVALGGCAAAPRYFHSTSEPPAGQEQLYRDDAACKVVMYQQPSAGLATGVIEGRVYNDCMRAKGWVRISR